MSKLKELDGYAHTKAHRALQTHPTYKRFLNSDKRGNLHIDAKAVTAMERLDRFKQTMELRPMYHRKDERIRAHVLLCWLSLLLIRVAENSTGRTWRDIRSTMKTMYLVTHQSGTTKIRQRTEVTQEQGEILSALGYNHPP